MQESLLNIIFPIVLNTIRESHQPFLIKGGASIKYHILYEKGIDTTGLTTDIDIAPLVDDPDYKNRSLQMNKLFSEQLVYNITNQFGNELSVHIKTKYDLITIQIQYQGILYDLIDISYINPFDEGSTFIKAINHVYGSYDNFLQQMNSEITPLQLELCVAVYGFELYNNYLEDINHRKEQLADWIQQREDLEVEMFTEDIPSENMESRLRELNFYIDRYRHQVSDDYITKIIRKIERFQRKISLIQDLYGFYC